MTTKDINKKAKEFSNEIISYAVENYCNDDNYWLYFLSKVTENLIRASSGYLAEVCNEEE